jgi:hypothetical protein
VHQRACDPHAQELGLLESRPLVGSQGNTILGMSIVEGDVEIGHEYQVVGPLKVALGLVAAFGFAKEHFCFIASQVGQPSGHSEARHPRRLIQVVAPQRVPRCPTRRGDSGNVHGDDSRHLWYKRPPPARTEPPHRDVKHSSA